MSTFPALPWRRLQRGWVCTARGSTQPPPQPLLPACWAPVTSEANRTRQSPGCLHVKGRWQSHRCPKATGGGMFPGFRPGVPLSRTSTQHPRGTVFAGAANGCFRELPLELTLLPAALVTAGRARGSLAGTRVSGCVHACVSLAGRSHWTRRLDPAIRFLPTA